MQVNRNDLPLEPARAKAFAKFFKNYMSVWSLIVAALPVPVTALNLIPVYNSHRGFLSVYTTLFCFLLLGFVFFNRFNLARLMFRLPLVHNTLNKIFNVILGNIVNWIPFICIVLSFSSLMVYHTLLQSSFEQTILSPNVVKEASIDSLKNQYFKIVGLINFDWKNLDWKNLDDGSSIFSNKADSLAFEIASTTEEIISTHAKILSGNAKTILKYAQLNEIKTGIFFEYSYYFPKGISGDFLLILFYILFFIFAEAAFILMALKEYLLDLMGIRDIDLITGKKSYIENEEAVK